MIDHLRSETVTETNYLFKINEQMDNSTDYLSEVLAISKDSAKALLISKPFGLEHILEQYLSNPKFLEEVGIAQISNAPSDQHFGRCPICLEYTDLMESLPCKHPFCNTCFAEYFDHMVNLSAYN
jgi:Zinc finger, C3HC4 type (RING finger).